MSYSAMMRQQKAGVQKFSNQDFHEAETCFQAALKEAESYSYPNAYTAKLYKMLAVYYFALDSFSQSEQCFKNALGIERNLLAPNSLAAARSLNQLGLLYQAWGKIDEAKRAYHHALDIEEKAHYLRWPEVNSKLQHFSLHHLAMLLCAQDRHSDGIKLCQRAKDMMEITNGVDDQDRSIVDHCRAVNYCCRDCYPQAKEICACVVGLCIEQIQRDYLGCAIRQGKET